MRIDILGKIREKKLAYKNTLLPLYEAIVNSIQAIDEDSATKPGIITIELFRLPQTKMVMQVGEEEITSRTPIIDFVIRDNGAGFNEDNFESFDHAHSSYKYTKGGKGIGRITWLRAFKKVEIDSVFKVNGHFAQRKFDFMPTRVGIEHHDLKEIKDSTIKRFTEVRLKGLKEDYQKWCNSEAEDIALKIMEHCFIYFLQSDCPRIVVVDQGEDIVVNDLFRLYTKGKVESVPLKIKKLEFQVELVKLYSSKPDNKIHLCANTREAQTMKISEEIPELDISFSDEYGEKYSIAAFVTGEYLNHHVNEERTEISFLKKSANDNALQDEITLEELKEGIANIIRARFEELISTLSVNRDDKIKQFVSEHPRYRQLLKYKPERVRKIPSSLEGAKLELELFKIQQELELEVKSEADEILKGLDKFVDQEDFKNKYSEHYQKIIEVGNSKLSEYILYRKVVLDLLEKHLKKTINGKFATEEMVHKLVFPLRTDSDEIGYDVHNLWLIDERLAFHKYLASDKLLKQVKELKSDSSDRTDLIVFNRPFAFSADEKPYTSVVLVEFKRPMRDDYDDEENPIAQINRYARQIIAGEKKDKYGRDFDLRGKTPIYAYIVCDLTKKLRSFAEEGGYKPLPDNDGYFFFNENYSMYVEVISFDKLVRDSKQRNKALFDKLSLTTL